MLADFSDDEIEVVLAHEIAHHVHGDIWKGIAFESVLIVAGFYLASRGARGRWRRRRDCAASTTSPGCRCCCWPPARSRSVMVPAAHAMSRAFERKRRSLRAAT